MSVPPARPAATAAVALGLGLLLLLTLAPASATRMQTWPFAAAAAGFWLLPVVIAVVRLALRRPDARLGGPLDLAFAALALAGLAATAVSPLRATLAPHLLPFLGALALPYALRPLVRSPRLDLASIAFLAPLLLATGALWLAAPANLAAPHERNDQPFGHANATGSVCALAACWSLYLATRAPSRVWRLVHLGSAALALLHVGFSQSRGSLLALAAAALVVAGLVFLRRGRLLLFLGVGALTVGTLVVSNARLREAALTGRWSGADSESNAQRLAMIAGGFALAAERPLLGWGPGSVPHVFPAVRARLPGQPDNYLQLHNTPAQLAATLGLAGLLAASALLLALGLRLRSALRDLANEPQTLALAAALA
ncbi:MAG: O-antigen ligase family protein, partial [Opitutaceae bacterium]|nr:O-antigen ligase family protein [Opitutaceae bacterium]